MRGEGHLDKGHAWWGVVERVVRCGGWGRGMVVREWVVRGGMVEREPISKASHCDAH